MELEFLRSLVIILGVSAVVIFVLGRLKISSIVGFLIAGVILGPYGFKLIEDVKEVELFAEIGIILLMFTIGLEFSLRNLLMLRKIVFGGGFLQITITTGIVSLLSYIFLQEYINISIFYGFLISLSSTAIVMKILQDSGELHTPHGRLAFGILIFQDLCVVPLLLFVPFLGGNGGNTVSFAFILLKAALFIGALLFSTYWAVPRMLHEVVSIRSRELFVITIILLCIGTALLSSFMGLSLALGAFLAGIVISESEYAAQAIADILPMKESFIGIFFVSIGMLMDLQFLMSNLSYAIVIVLLILLIKIIAVALSACITGHSLRSSVQTGFYISQVGEFSFILALAGKSQDLMTESMYQIFLSASIITMILTPFMIKASPYISTMFVSRNILERWRKVRGEWESSTERRAEHVVIIGFGVNGRNLARVLKETEIPYVVLELNNNTVRRMKKKGEPIYYGDGTNREILHKLGIRTARILVVAISDAAATRRIVQIARLENPDLHIIVRTRYVTEVNHLVKLGADEIIPEEFETSIEIFSRVLHHYHTPINIIREYIDKIREDSYSVLRDIKLPDKGIAERYEFLQGIESETYMITSRCNKIECSMKELDLRAKTGATIIAIKRGEDIYQNPSASFILRDGDIVLIIGKQEDINKAMRYIETGELV